MSELRMTADHEWIHMEPDGTGTVGITPYAQEQLGDVVYVELPQVGRRVAKGEEVAVIESVKAAAECKAPVSGTVVAVNMRLVDDPGAVNRDPLGEGWFFRLKVDDARELAQLLDEAAYRSLIAK